MPLWDGYDISGDDGIFQGNPSGFIWSLFHSAEENLLQCGFGSNVTFWNIINVFVDFFRPIRYLVNGQFGFYKSRLGGQCWERITAYSTTFQGEVIHWCPCQPHALHICHCPWEVSFRCLEVEKTRVVNTRWAPDPVISYHRSQGYSIGGVGSGRLG